MNIFYLKLLIFDNLENQNDERGPLVPKLF